MFTKAFIIAAIASGILAAPAATTVSAGDACRNTCIQDAVNAGKSPNFAECAASAAACADTPAVTAAPTATSAGEACRVKCIQDAVNAGNSPNFAACAASSASCENAAAKTTAPAAINTSAGEACRTKCIQDAVNAGHSPNFAECAASSAACAGASPVTSTTVVNTPQSTAAALPAGSQPRLVDGVPGWTIEALSRYCGEGATGCDYNFDINFNDGSAKNHCTIIRMIANAPTESWYDIQCSSTAQDIRVSWGYATEPAPAFAVITIVDSKSKNLAWFGASNVNEQPVTPSSPYGSGVYGNVGPQPVYTF